MSDAPRADRAEFVVRDTCIACGSRDLAVLDAGPFTAGPVRAFIEQDPWGVSPLPFLEGREWEYVRCNACRQAFHTRLLTPAWQEVRFREWMSGDAIRAFERSRGFHSPQNLFAKGTATAKHVLRLERMTRAVRGDAAVRLLDFGCGWGEFLRMAKLFGFDAAGVERSPDRQQFLAAHGVPAFPDLQAAADALGPTVHAATLFQVLEHLDDPLAALRGVHALMVPDGVLVLEVPNCEGVTGIRTAANYYDIHPLEHINCFTPTSLTRFAERAGFAAVPAVAAHVTTRLTKAITGEAKRWTPVGAAPTTDQYFRRV